MEFGINQYGIPMSLFNQYTSFIMVKTCHVQCISKWKISLMKFEFQISKDELLYSLETYQTAVHGSL